jgi:transposase
LAGGKKNAARLNASLVFLDEAGFLMAPLVRRSWSPCGRTPRFYQRGRCLRKVSAIGVLVVPPARDRVHCYFRLHPDANVNGLLVVAFLRELQRQLKTPIMLLWDRLRAHRSEEVKSYLQHTPAIRSIFFPPYAPELNPVEQIWGYTKRNQLANHAALDLDILASAARQALRSVQCRPSLLHSFLVHSPLFLRLT